LTWSSRAVGTALVVLAAGAPGRLRAQAPTIDTIIVVNRNIFDFAAGDAPGFLARLANSLHVTTRSRVIRRTLLVNPGDRYDSARVAESERALRNLYVFSRVRIDTTRLDGRLGLRVATTDGWSTKPQLGYSSAGGSVSWLVGLVEDNLLGTATALTAVYNHTPDRNIFTLGYANPHFFSRRARLETEYEARSDGKRGRWLVGLPFYETAARRAVAFDGLAAAESVLVFRQASDTGLVTDTLHHRALRLGVDVGFAPRAASRGYLRLWAGARWRREGFAPRDSVLPDSVFGTVGAGVDVGHVRFQVLEWFNSYARREDVDLSQLVHVGAWAAPRAWGYPSGRAGVGLEASAQASALWPGGFVVLRGAGNAVFTAGAPDSGRVAGAVTVASQNLRGQTLILHLEGARLRRPAPDALFDLWYDHKGPRVYGIHEFTGTRLAWLTVEDRVLVADDLWGLLGVGVAPFVDYGGAWYGAGDSPYPGEPARLWGDVGLSLRLGPTRAVRGDVAEFAVGYRFGHGTGFPGSGWGLAIRKGITY
jgi:hypothetical protein